MKRNKFSLSNYKLFSCDMAELIPIGVFEVLPGDTIQHATTALVRASPLVSPVMHPVEVRIHHWYVPYRLCWDSWEDFITGGPDGMNASAFPTITLSGGAVAGGLYDYMGVPPGGTNVQLSALPNRAYNLIWSEWYRDQDLQTELAVSKADGADVTTDRNLQFCAWEKDYYTSARPWEQKGPSITIPIGSTAPVVSDGTGIPKFTSANLASFNLVSGPSTASASYSGVSGAGVQNAAWQDPELKADLSGASAVTINALREAMALQRFEEARARYGSRYVEYLRYLGVRSSDARLQRPEYLGGGKNTIQFSEVLQTAAGDGSVGNTVGALKGHGIGAMRSNRYRRFIEEHGIVMSLMSIRPKTIYGNNLPRMWRRRVKEDFWQRELEHIGQQEVANQEVYVAHSAPDGVFGYQDRYDEYRRQESTIAAEFRSTLNYWHMARIFASDPALNASFVKCDPTERIFASSVTDVMYVMANHSIQARRLVAKTGKSFIF